MPEAQSLNQAFVAAATSLRQAGIETPELDARLLLCHASGLSHEATIARAREGLRPEAAARLDEAIARRLKREPVARITGFREFFGRTFRLGPQTLDPRPDTETIVETALDLVEERDWRERRLRLLDLGTEARASTPAELGQRLAADIEKWAAVVKQAGLEPR